MTEYSRNKFLPNKMCNQILSLCKNVKLAFMKKIYVSVLTSDSSDALVSFGKIKGQSDEQETERGLTTVWLVGCGALP